MGDTQINSVANGTALTDAVNLGQLQAGLGGDVTPAELTVVKKLASRGVASAAVVTLTPSAPGKAVFNLGVGHYEPELELIHS